MSMCPAETVISQIYLQLRDGKWPSLNEDILREELFVLKGRDSFCSIFDFSV